MKTKLTFTLKDAIRAEACNKGIKLFRNFHGENVSWNKEFNILSLLESNCVSDCIWALRITKQDSREVSEEIVRRANVSAYDFSAVNDASDSAYSAACAFSAAYEAAYAAGNATAYSITNTAYDAAFNKERFRQKQDLLELIEGNL